MTWLEFSSSDYAASIMNVCNPSTLESTLLHHMMMMMMIIIIITIIYYV